MISSRTLSPAERRRAEEFATLLEGGRAPEGDELADLVTLASTLRPAALAPAPDFRAELRERLVREAAARTPAAVPAPRTSADRAPRIRHRLTQAVGLATAATVLSGAGLAFASSNAVPGDPLYSVKRGIESVQLSLARADLPQGRELLEQANSRLAEAELLAQGDQSRDAVTVARLQVLLTEMDTSLSAGALKLQGVYRETGDPEALTVLDQFVVDQTERINDLISLLDPSLRAFARSLADRLDAIGTEVRVLTVAASGAPSVVDTAVSTVADALDPSSRREQAAAAAAAHDHPAAAAGGGSGSGADAAPAGDAAGAAGDAADDVAGGDAADSSDNGGLLGGILGGSGSSAGGDVAGDVPADTAPPTEPPADNVPADPGPQITLPTPLESVVDDVTGTVGLCLPLLTDPC